MGFAKLEKLERLKNGLTITMLVRPFKPIQSWYCFVLCTTKNSSRALQRPTEITRRANGILRATCFTLATTLLKLALETQARSRRRTGLKTVLPLHCSHLWRRATTRPLLAGLATGPAPNRT